MNKKDIILIVGVVLIVVVALLVFGKTPEKELLVLSGEEVGSIKIDYATYTKKVENNENFIVIIESTDCGFCQMYMPIVEEVAKDLSIPVYYIDTSELSKEDLSSLNENNEYLSKTKWGTPTTLLMSGEKVVDSLSQYVEEKEFTKFIKGNISLEKNKESE